MYRTGDACDIVTCTVNFHPVSKAKDSKLFSVFGEHDRLGKTQSKHKQLNTIRYTWQSWKKKRVRLSKVLRSS